jgi:hypothetical protein
LDIHEYKNLTGASSARNTSRSDGNYANKYAKYLDENTGPETNRLRRMYKYYGGDEEKIARWIERMSMPVRSLNVTGYARTQFQEKYRYILAEDFLDQQVLSYVENRVSFEIARLSQKRYRYRKGSKNGYRKAKEKRAQEVAASISSLYGQLVSALSKHQVLIQDLSAVPSGAGGGIVKTGVYAGGR